MIKDIKTILYATDLSNTSVYAFRYALCLANALDVRLHLLHVVEPVSEEMRMTLQLFVADRKARDVAINHRRETVKALLEERQAVYWQHLPKDDQALRDRVDDIEIVEGFAAEEILKKADSLSAGMILMGSHEQGVSHTFLGTVAKRVLRRSRIPTLIVPYVQD